MNYMVTQKRKIYKEERIVKCRHKLLPLFVSRFLPCCADKADKKALAEVLDILKKTCLKWMVKNKMCFKYSTEEAIYV
jgi:hypothetical protein